MYVIVSNDYRGCGYRDMSEDLQDRYDNLLSLINPNINEIPESQKTEIQAKLMIEMQEESFAELHNGATIIEYDETKVHPIKEIEEYGGENVHFENGPATDDVEHVIYMNTYDPIEGISSFNYDADTDTYNNNIDYGDNEGIIAEWQIKSSRQVAKSLLKELPREEQKVFEQYLNFSSASLKDIKEMLPLTPDQRENYLLMFANSCVPEEKRAIYAKTLSKEEINILRQSPLRTRDEHTWDVLTSNNLALTFIDMTRFRDAVWDNPNLIQFMDRIPVKKSLDKEYSDIEYHAKMKKQCLDMAISSAKRKNIDISQLIPENDKLLLNENQKPNLEQSTLER